MMSTPCQIGLFFGSFNPIHNGHTQLAEHILTHSGLTEIWLVVSPCNPFKQHAGLIAESHRLRMAELALAGRPAIRACDVEFDMPKPSYTIRTLQRLSALYPQNRFTLIMGGDNLPGFGQWKEAETIARNYPILVYPRQEAGQRATTAAPDLPFVDLQMVQAPLLPISSTEIRRLIAQKKDASAWLHPDVARYIEANGLYAD